MSKKLIKVNIKGNKCYHVFENLDKEEFIIPITKDEYLALGEKGAGQPKLDGHRWKYSLETPEYDTSSGFLEEGQYANLDDNYFIIGVGKYKFQNPAIKKECIENDIITSQGLFDIKRDFNIKL